MPTICTATVDVGMAGYGKNQAERAILRVAGPMKVGLTYYRVSGVWHSVRTPAQSVLDTADLVLLGGHVYDVPSSVTAELDAAGLAYTTA